MSIINEDTIWFAMNEILTGGVFRTTNGGGSWTQQFSGGNQNPNKIYMFNVRIGFHSNSSASPNIYKTTNSGVNWSVNLSGENFNDMYFKDSLLGWKCSGSNIAFIRKTTNGGINWTIQNLPPESPPFIFSRMSKFTFVDQDTAWGVGGNIFYPNSQIRGVIYKTTNGGVNWGYQIPDTSIHITGYAFISFTDKQHGWAYHQLQQGGVHTTNGGDTITYFTSVQQIGNEIPKEFKLLQNFPNPFNPFTNIRYNINASSFVTLTIYDVTGRQLSSLINEKQGAGIYQYTFDGSNLSSGVYFYSMLIDNKPVETKKMILIK
jgi:hypothetical protein